MKKTVISSDYADLGEEIASLPEKFAAEGSLLFAGRNEIRLMTIGGRLLVVKRYGRLNTLRAVSYTLFSSSKASRAYHYAREMSRRGIDTPTAVAYIEIFRRGLLRDCYFVSEYTADRPLFDVLVDTPAYDRRLAAEVGRFVATMHSRGVIHGDPNLNNILYRPLGAGDYHFSVIDTNRSRFSGLKGAAKESKVIKDLKDFSFFPSLSRQACLANLKRLTHRRDLLHDILTAYAEARGWDAAATIAAVERRLGRFERNRRRRHAIQRFFGGHPH